MIQPLTSDQLRKVADQVDAWTAIAWAEGDSPTAILRVNGVPTARLLWWEKKKIYLADFPDSLAPTNPVDIEKEYEVSEEL